MKLRDDLEKLDGKNYGSYKALKGNYKFKNYIFNILKVQGDPFASPSLFSLEINLPQYKIAKEFYDNSSKKVAFEDYVLRKLNKLFYRLGKRTGSGKSGELNILSPNQEILKRSAVEIKKDILTIKFYGGLPANGRRINSKGAINMIFLEIPKIAKEIEIENLDLDKLKQHIKTNEKSDAIRRVLVEKNLIAFVENGSNLARKSSVDNKKLEGCIPFSSPKSLELQLDLDIGESVIGMGIPKGITIVTGGGFHGKSTFLSAIEKGVYNHIPNDGREGVITDFNSVKIRAEDGRWVGKTNISNFINNLPHKKNTENFSTENASGSVSQATNIIEAIELGATTLLIDEDTTATNFMVRDRKIQELITHDKEPITPFIERIESLKKKEISAIIVVGGLGDYFSKADYVLMLDEYKIKDVTKKAKKISKQFENSNIKDDNKEFEIIKRNLDPSKTSKVFPREFTKIKSRGIDELLIDKNNINLRYLEQLVENGQVPFIGESIKKILESPNNTQLAEILLNFQREINNKNISELLKSNSGNLVETRKYEIGGAIMRIRKDLFR